MIEFINYGSSILTFAFFLIALYLYKTSKEKSYFLSIITGLMFLYTLFVMPIIQMGKAEENVVSYKKGITLSCTSGFLMLSETFSVDKREWNLEGNYFIHKQIDQKIRVDKCVEF